MKKYLRKPTLPIIAGLLLSSLLLPSAFAADLPAGAVELHGVFTYKRNNSTAPSPGTSNWSVADKTCKALTAMGLPPGSWRLPTQPELTEVARLNLKDLGWSYDQKYTWTSTKGKYFSGDHLAVSLYGGFYTNYGDQIVAYVSCIHSNRE